MASRMERLHEKEERSTKNEHIYRKLDEYQINEMGSYSNIEGVAKLDGNEVNIEMVKKLINSSNSNTKKEKYVKQNVKELDYEEKNYDINDILDKAKEELPLDDNKYRNLKNYELLKQIKVNSEEEKEELKEIINTMALENLPDDLGMFDDLKSDTMVGDSDSIKKIIEEAKESEEEKEEVVEQEPVIDRSFYTASFNLSDEELSDFKNIGLDIKRNNRLMKILILISSIILAVIILIVVAKTIF